MMSFIMETVPADAAFLAIAGRYYVRRCNDMDPEESLQDGTKGPASFARATGALLPKTRRAGRAVPESRLQAIITAHIIPPRNGEEGGVGRHATHG